MKQRTEIPPQTGERPGDPQGPLDLSASDWRSTLKRTVSEFKEDRATITAAGLAFYWFLSLFPAMIALVGFVGLLGLPASVVEAIVEGLYTALPPDAAAVLGDALKDAGGREQGATVAAVAGLAIAAWSASSGMAALQSGLNVAYDVLEDRKFVAKRVRSFLLMLVTLVLGGLASALAVFGGPLGRWLQGYVPLGQDVFIVVWNIARWIATAAAVSVLFSVMFYLGPNRRQPAWRWVSAGGVVATLIWIAASTGFSLYATTLGSYDQTYGALAGVVVLILWLFLTGIAILVGGELNAELERQGDRRGRRNREAGRTGRRR